MALIFTQHQKGNILTPGSYVILPLILYKILNFERSEDEADKS